MFFAILIVLIGYALVLMCAVAIYVNISAEVTNKEKSFEGKVSVIVPFRNEAANLTKLVESLKLQVYQDYEVIFINDHSVDNSLEVLQRALIGVSFSYRIFNLKEIEGKKAAIDFGVRNSSGEVILTTDADCWFDQFWILKMVEPFVKEQVQMVAGPVVLEGKSLFQKFQRVEFGAIMAVSGVLITSKKPTMANGANLAYRKSAFEKVNGFEGIDQTPSGDDELLMMKIARIYKKAVFFSKSSQSVVHTNALDNFIDFVQQRKRWASKWKVGNRISTIVSALAVFTIQLSYVLGLVMLFSDENYLKMYWPVFALKIMCEFFLIRSFFNSVNQKWPILHFFLLQTFYPFYVLYFGVVSNFGNFQWKGRSFRI